MNVSKEKIEAAIAAYNQTFNLEEPMSGFLFEHGGQDIIRIGIFGGHPAGDAYFKSEEEAIDYVVWLKEARWIRDEVGFIVLPTKA